LKSVPFLPLSSLLYVTLLILCFFTMLFFIRCPPLSLALLLLFSPSLADSCRRIRGTSSRESVSFFFFYFFLCMNPCLPALFSSPKRIHLDKYWSLRPLLPIYWMVLSCCKLFFFPLSPPCLPPPFPIFLFKIFVIC